VIPIPHFPSIRSRGSELGTTRTDQPTPFGDEPGLRMAKTSGCVEASLVSQNGQNPVPLTNFVKSKSEGRTVEVSAMITQRPVKMSLRI
jgi:hypothetical protein